MRQFLADEWRALATLNRSDRPWEMPAAAALASGLQSSSAWPSTNPGWDWQDRLAAWSFCTCPRRGWRSAWPALVVPLLVTITLLVTMVCRFFAAPPPGLLFFVMAAAIGAHSPVHGRDALTQVGAVALGTTVAVAIAFLYCLYMLSRHGVPAPNPPSQPDFNIVVTDSVVMATFVGLSLLAAHAL
jgi:hypothetical protein